jgi:hypothetical protein
MQKSTFKLTKHELDFISDPIYMQMKQKLIRNFYDAMHGIGSWLMAKYYPNRKLNFKVTRGENYLDMPYVVLDTPQLSTQHMEQHLRIMLWWGHYISLQYFIRVDALTLEKLNSLKHLPYRVLITDNLFNNNLEDTDFIDLSALNKTQFTPNQLTKICCRVELSELENLEQNIEIFMSHVKNY